MRSRGLACSILAVLAICGGTQHAQASSSLNDARILTGGAGVCVRHYHLMPFKPTPNVRVVDQAADIKCEQGCVLELNKGNRVKLAPGAAVMIGPYYFVPLEGEHKPMTRSQRVDIIEGDVEGFSPAGTEGYALTFAASGGLVTFRAGHVHVAERSDHASIAALEGTARVKSGGTWVSASPGQVLRVGPREKPVAHPLPTAPVWSRGGHGCANALELVENGGTRRVGGCWSPAPGAASYRVEIARDAEFTSKIDELETKDAQFVSSPLAVGYYYARVRGIDPDGIEGPPSSVRRLGVVPLEPPPGAVAELATHTLIVPAKAPISFGARGPLEIAVGNGGFVKAPPSIILDDRAEHHLRLRLEGDAGSESDLRVLNRALRADIQLTPHLPRWPYDPIDLYVNIEDPSGKIRPMSVQPRIQVLVGIHEVPVEWTHSDNTWVARLQPRNTPGPSVVRVIVYDQDGNLLGRNFVEIEGTPLPTVNELAGSRHQIAQN